MWPRFEILFAFDFRRMQEQLEFPDKVVPRWFGHCLSLPPDSGIGLGSTERTGEKGAARFKQSTLRPTIPHPAQWKRQAGSRMTTDFDLEADLTSEGTQRGTPRKRALFGLGCCGSESPIDDVAEAQVGLLADNNLPEWTHSPGVGLTDTVARLQREVEELHSDSMYTITPGRHQPRLNAHAGPYARQLKCLGLRVRLAGNNTNRCSMPL